MPAAAASDAYICRRTLVGLLQQLERPGAHLAWPPQGHTFLLHAPDTDCHASPLYRPLQLAISWCLWAQEDLDLALGIEPDLQIDPFLVPRFGWGLDRTLDGRRSGQRCGQWRKGFARFASSCTSRFDRGVPVHARACVRTNARPSAPVQMRVRQRAHW